MKKIPALVFFALAALAAGARAQDAVPGSSTDPKLIEPGTAPGPAPSRRAVPQPQPRALEPYQWGSFLVYPEIVFTEMYDDNIYSSNTGAVNDHALIVSPSVWLQSNWQRHFLRLHASADVARYLDQRTEDSEDYRVSAEGRHDVSPDTNVYGGMRVGSEHEDRESPEVRNGIEPTRYKVGRLYGGMFQQFGRASLRVGVNVLELDFDDVPFVMGSGGTAIINNDDRDRVQLGAGVRLGYEVAPRLVLFAQLSADHRRYDDEVDDLGMVRDSDGGRALLGLRAFVPESFKAEIYAGKMRQDYDDARLADVDRPAAGGNVVVRVTRNTTASLFADRTVEETTVFAAGTPVEPASSYINTYVQANVDHHFTPALSAYAFASFSRAAYQGILREDDYRSGGAGFVYRIARNVYLDVTYQQRKLDSEVPTENFKRDQLFARVALPLAR